MEMDFGCDDEVDDEGRVTERKVSLVLIVWQGLRVDIQKVSYLI